MGKHGTKKVDLKTIKVTEISEDSKVSVMIESSESPKNVFFGDASYW